MAHELDRRSFLRRVAGGVLVAGAGFVAGTTESGARKRRRRRLLVDADPTDRARPQQPPVYRTPARPRRLPNPGPNAPPSRPMERFIICPGNPRCPRRGP